MPALSPAQKGVLQGVAAGLVIIQAVALLALRKPLQHDTDRTLLWLKWNAPKAACLAAHIGRIGNHRFLSPDDIQGSGFGQGSAQVRVMQATLQNTLEQLILAVAVHGAFAALAPPEWLILIPAFSMVFVAGRLLFAWGYRFGAPGRALGFCLTMWPTLFMLVCACAWLYKDPW